MHSTFGRAALFSALLSTWLILLFTGWIFGGAVHLVLLAAVSIFPWRALSAGADDQQE